MCVECKDKRWENCEECSAQYTSKQTNSAAPTEICPNCGGTAVRVGLQRRCDTCRLFT
jgi:hypothetical protein